MFVSIVGGDLVGEMTPTTQSQDAVNARRTLKYRHHKRYLSDDDRNSLKTILTHLNRKDLIPGFASTVKFSYSPSTMTANLVDSNRPTQTIVVAWLERPAYFYARGRYLGYPDCCLDHHRANHKTEGIERAPIGIARCPKHTDRSIESYLDLMNSNRLHPEPQLVKAAIPAPKDFFLRLTQLHLTQKIK
jgi:hypothetical protein